jgi:hypothetical protein
MPISSREKQLARALAWALPLAEEQHELLYPGETYAKDGYVAGSVHHARETLAEAEGDRREEEEVA